MTSAYVDEANTMSAKARITVFIYNNNEKTKKVSRFYSSQNDVLLNLYLYQLTMYRLNKYNAN